jgi:hypothetical protein
MENTTGERAICTETESWTVLEQLAREGARKMLQQALEMEVEAYISRPS